MMIFGVDPGVHGAIAVLNEGAVDAYVADTMLVQVGKKKRTSYVVSAMARRIWNCIPKVGSVDPSTYSHAFVEKSQPFPGQGVVSQFSVGYGLGLWEMAFTMAGVPVTLVHPKTWQKQLFEGEPKMDTKLVSLRVAMRLFPHVDFYRGHKKPLDGISDALLIATYGKRVLQGQEAVNGGDSLQG